MSRKKDERTLKGEINGVMPYVAPEVLSGEQQFTQAADIYGFGVIMTEMTSGQRPFDGHKFDHKLAIKICKELRPEFESGTPKCFIELAKKCMNSDLQEWSKASDIYQTIDDWLSEIDLFNRIKDWLEKIASSNDNGIKDLLKKIASPDNEFKNLLNKIDDYKIKDWLKKIANSEDNEIKNWHVKLASSNSFDEIKDWLKKISYDCNEIAKQFIDADKVIKSLPIPKHSDEMYTSKIISTKLISKTIMADSAQMNFDITENSN